MKRTFIMTALLSSLFSLQSLGQTLFTIGNDKVSSVEFLKAFEKNNSLTKGKKSQQIQEYLDLYIGSKLKVKEALSRQMDTLPHVKFELNNLRNQIISNYIGDESTNKLLVKEAFDRSQKEVRVAQLFIPKSEENALSKIQTAQKRIQQGEDFLKVAQQVAPETSGDIGWFTVFGLPYKVETIVYELAKGKTSEIVTSQNGYYLFKKLDERKALGKISASQILFAFPPNATTEEKKAIEQKAKAIYQRLLAGEEFAKLARENSNDSRTVSNGGKLPDFGVGEYELIFETPIFALQKDGDITAPFMSSVGYHIVKRNSLTSPVADANNEQNNQYLSSQINKEKRWQENRAKLSEKILQQVPFKKATIQEADLWAYGDSILERKNLPASVKLQPKESVFTIGKKAYTTTDWLNFIRINRSLIGTGANKYDATYKAFVHNAAYDYYKENLEEFNEAFRYQMNEFREGNLFFEIMQQEVWNKTQDANGELEKWYQSHKHNYKWEQSADVIVFYFSDNKLAASVHNDVNANPSNWKNYIGKENIIIDSSRMELSQIPYAARNGMSEGLITNPYYFEDTNTTSFVYILKMYSPGEIKTFEQAKGQVITEYQQELEKKWTAELRKKFPVVINKKELEKISK